MNQQIWDICVPNATPVTQFAAEEFARLIKRMDPCAVPNISLCAYAADRRALWIGRDAALPAPLQVEQAEIDDAIRMDVERCAGYITGSNDRSVLIGVYRFFREAGCVFVRPGRDGEFVPQKDSCSLEIRLSEKAAYRHRGICLEGANSYENVVDMIDFAPKLGFNEYFTQLFRPAFAFRRWYEHLGNPALLPTPVSSVTIDSFVADYEGAIHLRGMLHHRIGHGWVSRVLGITSGGWHEHNDENEVSEDRRRLIALINGERRLFAGSGIDTNLCYSSPEVKAILADAVVAYARENPQIQYLHFWLADQANNQCECDRCKPLRPSDQYVEILNLIDERLTAEGLSVRIVFLIYLDLLWAPVCARLVHPDRFVLMYAPIRRSYSIPMAEDRGRQAATFSRNHFVLPLEAGGTLPYLKEWQKVFRGDSFVFDYHYMWDYFNDPGCSQGIRIMSKDVENLGALGLNGMMSCQNQRVFMPNGLGMNILGEGLWSGKDLFDEKAVSYYKAAYGVDGEACMAFQETLSKLFDPPLLRGEKPIRSPEAAHRFAEIPACIDAFEPVINRNLRCGSAVIRRSWECLAFYARLCRFLSFVLYDAAVGDMGSAKSGWVRVREYVCDNESHFQREFDVFEFFNVWENKILPRIGPII